MSLDIHSRRWKRLRRAVLDRDGWTCLVPIDAAGQPDEAGRPHGIHLTELAPTAPTHATVDHIVPRTLGGTDALDNLRAACRRCNSRRSALATNATRTGPLNLSRAW